MYELKFLEWDSDFFNLKIYNLFADKLEDTEVLKLKKEINSADFDVVQTKIDLAYKKAINRVESLGFAFVDFHVAYKKIVNPSDYKANNSYEIRFAAINDFDDIKNIIKSLYKHSRFLSMGISQNSVDDFYREWARKSILGEFDDFCLVCCNKDRVAGFITCKILNDSEAKIGLVGTAKNFQGKKIGSMVLSFLENYLSQKGINTLFVTTEGSNILAQNFYIKNGFSVNEIKCILYLTKGIGANDSV